MTFDPSGKDPTYMRTIKEWIDACNKSHADACVPVPVSERPPHEIPTWVIDTIQHCLVPGSSVDRYVALSYVWPDNKGSPDDHLDGKHESLMLTERNLSEFQHPGHLSSNNSLNALPHIIKYAIGFTTHLGERYLWVDRLCVLQNNGLGCDDEVMRMDKIYGGAYLTFVAAAPDNMFSKGSSLEWPYRDRTVRWKTPIATLYLDLKSSKYSTRGWTYQEQILYN
ncbi:hypothetical protein E8E13_000773 [Curvularia kusanoi]|uniref:Heterokaryon incompatibility domain-containing protein n=1 Tax=Curvularia kusanoi TaxID=90978 RepID=A0A9P4W670_CURKU|nr:hypothetical protein E8E13_000773 [Curvularia kusanoi]